MYCIDPELVLNTKASAAQSKPQPAISLQPANVSPRQIQTNNNNHHIHHQYSPCLPDQPISMYKSNIIECSTSTVRHFISHTAVTDENSPYTQTLSESLSSDSVRSTQPASKQQRQSHIGIQYHSQVLDTAVLPSSASSTKRVRNEQVVNERTVSTSSSKGSRNSSRQVSVSDGSTYNNTSTLKSTTTSSVSPNSCCEQRESSSSSDRSKLPKTKLNVPRGSLPNRIIFKDNYTENSSTTTMSSYNTYNPTATTSYNPMTVTPINQSMEPINASTASYQSSLGESFVAQLSGATSTQPSRTATPRSMTNQSSLDDDCGSPCRSIGGTVCADDEERERVLQGVTDPKEKRRIKNRYAARKTRQKKLERTDQLEQENEGLRREKLRLIEETKKQNGIIEALMHSVKMHTSKCNNPDCKSDFPQVFDAAYANLITSSANNPSYNNQPPRQTNFQSFPKYEAQPPPNPPPRKRPHQPTTTTTTATTQLPVLPKISPATKQPRQLPALPHLTQRHSSPNPTTIVNQPQPFTTTTATSSSIPPSSITSAPPPPTKIAKTNQRATGGLPNMPAPGLPPRQNSITMKRGTKVPELKIKHSTFNPKSLQNNNQLPAPRRSPRLQSKVNQFEPIHYGKNDQLPAYTQFGNVKSEAPLSARTSDLCSFLDGLKHEGLVNTPVKSGGAMNTPTVTFASVDSPAARTRSRQQNEFKF